MAVIDQTSTETVVTADADYQIRVLDYVVSASAALKVQWQDTDGTALSGEICLPANGTVPAPFTPQGHFTTAKGKGVKLVQTGAGTVGGHFNYAKI